MSFPVGSSIDIAYEAGSTRCNTLAGFLNDRNGLLARKTESHVLREFYLSAICS